MSGPRIHQTIAVSSSAPITMSNNRHRVLFRLAGPRHRTGVSSALKLDEAVTTLRQSQTGARRADIEF